MNFPKFTTKKILILVTLLAVPGFLYWMLTEKGKNRYKAPPIYGPKQVAATFHTVRRKQIPDTLYHTIRNFKLINQNSQEYVFPAPDPRITVVNFFFTRCDSFCPAMNKQMQRLAKAYGQNNLLQFVSISVDPENDTPDKLAAYAKTFDASSAKWNFLTGPKGLIYDLAKKDFLVDVLPDPQNSANFIHSPMLILLDTQKRIRGYYNSLRKEEADKLNDEIKVLITEELRNIK